VIERGRRRSGGRTPGSAQRPADLLCVTSAGSRRRGGDGRRRRGGDGG
jgi:hypothetical protein